MAERTLSLIELVPENSFALKLKNAVIDVIRLCWESATDDVARAREFDFQDRFVQLNLLAYAFTALGTPPMFLKGIHWESIIGSNPITNRDVANEIAKAEQYILKRYGQSVRLRPAKFTMRDWGIEDLSYRNPIR